MLFFHLARTETHGVVVSDPARNLETCGSTPGIKKFGVLWASPRKVPSSNINPVTDCLHLFRGLPQYFEVNAGIISRNKPHQPLKYLPFIITSSSPSTLYSHCC
jgi:hypothetical protein